MSATHANAKTGLDLQPNNYCILEGCYRATGQELICLIPVTFAYSQPHYLLDISLSCKTCVPVKAGFGLGNRTCSVTRSPQEVSQVALLGELQAGVPQLWGSLRLNSLFQLNGGDLAAKAQSLC